MFSIDQVNRNKTEDVLLSIMHCNIRSIRRNEDLLLAFLSEHKFTYNIVALSETWLKIQETVAISGYDVIYSSRNTVTRGGGVALFIRSSIPYNVLSDMTINSNVIESAFVSLSSGTVVGVIYRPPSSSIPLFIDAMEGILNDVSNKHKGPVIKSGDFNIDASGSLHNDYLLLLESFNFKNLILQPTRVTATTSTCIDHILSNCDNVFAGVYDVNIADHSPIFALLCDRLATPNRPSITKKPRVDYHRLQNKLINLNSCFVYDTDVHREHENFIHHLTKAISECTTQVHHKYTEPLCPWMNNSILQAIKEKDTWYHRWKRQKQNSYYLQQFRSSRNLVVAMIRKRKKEYNSSLIERAQGNTKQMWDIINKVIGKSSKKQVIPDRVSVDVVDNFNAFFTSIGPQLAAKISTTSCEENIAHVEGIFSFRDINYEELVTIVAGMANNKATGYDGITVKMLKDNIDVLAPILLKLFNHSLQDGVYPDVLKIAKIYPVYKHGDVNDPSSYRPISVLSVINTIFEKLISLQLRVYVESNNIITNFQHGFRQNRSTSTAVMEMTQAICTSLHSNEIAIGIFLDLQKAFDTVVHSILLHKLHKYGFRGPTYNLFMSYLANRKQSVCLDNIRSSQMTVETGVPQGSVLVPALFSLYINDFPNILTHSKAVSYADDTVIIFTGKTLSEIQPVINQELTRISSWFKANKLTINSTKSKYILFTSRSKNLNEASLKLFIDNFELEQVYTIKYLGVTLDCHLNWKNHIKNVCSRLASVCYVLLRARMYFQLSTLKVIYFSLFHCHLTYCCETWAFTFKTYLDPIFKLQKRALRTITFSQLHTPSEVLFRDLQILPLKLVSEMKIAIIVNKIFHNSYPLSLNLFIIPARNTRHANQVNFNLPITRNTYGERLIQNFGAKIWNSVPLEIKMANNFIFSIKTFYRSKLG